MDEFEKNVVQKHHDNTTQWVNEFSKKRGWFVQVSFIFDQVTITLKGFDLYKWVSVNF